VTGLPVAQADLVEAAAYGAARLAAIGHTGAGPDAPAALAAWQAPRHTRRPHPARTAAYADVLERFKGTYRALRQASACPS
jgi:sugar (pentulose or hexulose) kinase